MDPHEKPKSRPLRSGAKSSLSILWEMMEDGRLPICEITKDGMRSLNPPMADKIELALAIDLDLVMAYRLLYYCDAISLIPDNAFDALDRDAASKAPVDHPIHKPGSDRRDDYDPAVRALALYLRLRYSKRTEALIDFEESEGDEFDTINPDDFVTIPANTDIPDKPAKAKKRGGQYDCPPPKQTLF